ncbi:MAG: hypothetical protein FJ403_00430 [Verrucomicrobia bacterium]|nr:hypothetical protein [Verrucomicrobiota bacterium]
MTPDLTNQVTAGLLLMTLGIVVAILFSFVFLVVRYMRMRKNWSQNSSSRANKNELPSDPGFRVAALDVPSRWLAIRSSNLVAVQSALGLHNPIPCSWSDGLSRHNESTLFVSPPVKDWILVIGQGLPDPAEDVDECFRFVLKLSRTMGHVQFFSANRAVNHHAWVRADDGHVQRAYAWAGETVWNQGRLTQAEIDLGLKCFGYAENAPMTGFSEQSHQLNAERINLLAARWSVDPSSIDEEMLPRREGISGELIHSRQH